MSDTPKHTPHTIDKNNKKDENESRSDDLNYSFPLDDPTGATLPDAQNQDNSSENVDQNRQDAPEELHSEPTSTAETAINVSGVSTKEVSQSGQENSSQNDMETNTTNTPNTELTPTEDISHSNTSENATPDETNNSLASSASEIDATSSTDEIADDKAAVDNTSDVSADNISKTTDSDEDSSDDNDDEDDENEDEEEDEDEDSPQSILDHFRELRTRFMRIAVSIVVGFGICWIFHNEIASIVYHPLVQVLPGDGAKSSSIIFTGVAEGFLTHMKLAIVAGIFLMSPFIFYQIWAFIAPGLYDEEKRFIVPVAISSALCFIAGGLFCYFVVFPNAFRFFMTYSEGAFQAMPSMKEYFGFTMQLMLAFGIIFEMPLFSFFLAKMGIVKAASMRKFRRYFIVIAFILGAFLTPPDPLSQFLMAGPLLILYELSIIIASFAEKKGKAKDEEDDDDDSDDDETEEDEDSESSITQKTV